jgi:hypothetical protein
MSFKSFLRKVNSIADEGVKESSSLGPIKNETKLKGNLLFNGILMDLNGEIIRKHRYKNLGIYYKNYYIAQDKYEGSRWGLFDKKTDKKIWIKNEPIHHEILITPKKNIIVFGKETKKYKGRNVDFDTILEYDFDGKLLSTYSMYNNLENFQKFHKKLTLDVPKIPFIPEFSKRHSKSPWGGFYDYYRLNSMQVLPLNILGKKDKRFQKGNWLLSCRHGSLIFILDKDSKEIVYSLNQKSIKSQIQGQHSVQMLKNGNLLIFDNGRYRNGSRVIELNPINLEIKFEYKTDGFFSESQGYVQKINSNYLITESEKGRIFMIDSKKEIIWEYVNEELQDKINSNYSKNYGKPLWIYRALYVK